MVCYLGGDHSNHLKNVQNVPDCSKLPENRSKIVGKWSTTNLIIERRNPGKKKENVPGIEVKLYLDDEKMREGKKASTW